MCTNLQILLSVCIFESSQRLWGWGRPDLTYLWWPHLNIEIFGGGKGGGGAAVGFRIHILYSTLKWSGGEGRETEGGEGNEHEEWGVRGEMWEKWEEEREAKGKGGGEKYCGWDVEKKD